MTKKTYYFSAFLFAAGLGILVHGVIRDYALIRLLGMFLIGIWYILVFGYKEER